jgi:ATP-dependent protease ClpP protease subunit
MIKTIYLTGEINFDSTSKVINEILETQQNKEILEILLYITSGGGFFYPAFALYDIIKSSIIPVTTIALGYCASSAVPILQAGKTRKASKNTVFMIHHSSNMIENTPFNEFNKQVDQYQIEHGKFLELTISKSYIKRDFFETLSTSFYFDVSKALELGLIDEVLK